MQKKIVVASHNTGKIKEIKNLLKPFKFKVYSALDFKIKEPKETGKTFIENSIIKAKVVSQKSNCIALADDSGLCINSLNGNPGIYSARWAGKNKDFRLGYRKNRRKNYKKYLQHLKEIRRAYFCCALTLFYPSGKAISFQGKVFGHLEFPARGLNGFGYDPIFVPKGYKKTFGEMKFDYKERISHRQIAFNKLKKYLIKI
jgi:XTP/dITP diphosphohydrolase